MSYLNTNELKESLTSILQSHNLNETLINQLLSDEFINGAFELIQNEPENDEFITFARNFSEEQNLNSLMNAKDRISEELMKEGYFTDIFQYVIDAWRDIDFSNSTIMQISSIEDNDSSSKFEAIFDTVLEIAEFVPALKAPAKELKIYKHIAVGVYEQDKKFYDIADRFSQELWAIATGARGAFTTAESTTSPLVIDLDGNGVETTTEEDGVYFDHDNNGFAEKTAWVGKDDGLLVRDINNNGQIDDGTELFGNNTVLSNGQKATNGFEALKDLDSNNDNVFDSSDTAWNQVKVWKDANQNGEVDEEELLTLEQAMGDVRRLFACNVWESVAM